MLAFHIWLFFKLLLFPDSIEQVLNLMTSLLLVDVHTPITCSRVATPRHSHVLGAASLAF